jgi:hypothetical protein
MTPKSTVQDTVNRIRSTEPAFVQLMSSHESSHYNDLYRTQFAMLDQERAKVKILEDHLENLYGQLRRTIPREREMTENTLKSRIKETEYELKQTRKALKNLEGSKEGCGVM